MDSSAYRIVAKTGDGVIVSFEQPNDAHCFAYQLHLTARDHNQLRSETTAERWFRIGAATGDVSITEGRDSNAEFAGMTIADAVRLEAAASPGEIVIDSLTYKILAPTYQCLYSDPTVVRGKRKERFQVHRYLVDSQVSSNIHGSHAMQTRRFFVGAAAASGIGLVALFINKKHPLLGSWDPPLPTRRFVALLAWPTAQDQNVQASVIASVEAIGKELARAEAFDRDFSIIPQSDNSDSLSGDDLEKMTTAVGANLVLSVTGSAQSLNMLLLLSIVNPQSRAVLRKKSITLPSTQLAILPAKAVRIAADMLNVAYDRLSANGSDSGTHNSDAYRAFQRAEVYMAKDNDEGLESAIENYKQAIDYDPHYAVAHSRLSWAYLRSYALDGHAAALYLAGENSRTALALNPKLVDAHIGLASFYQQTGKFEEASDEFAAALSLDPHNPHTLLYQAKFYAQQNDWQRAERTFNTLLELRPNSWLAHNELGFIYTQQGKYRQALLECQLASLLVPKSSLAMANIGSVYLQLGSLPEAADSFTKSYRLEPNDEAAIGLAMINRIRGSLPKAITFAEDAVRLNPAFTTDWIELGDCYAAIGGHASQAVNAYQKALMLQKDKVENEPKDGPERMLLALCQLKAVDRPGAANLSLDKAEMLMAKDIDSQLIKLRVLVLMNKFEEALRLTVALLKQGATVFEISFMPDLQQFLQQSAVHEVLTRSQVAA